MSYSPSYVCIKKSASFLLSILFFSFCSYAFVLILLLKIVDFEQRSTVCNESKKTARIRNCFNLYHTCSRIPNWKVTKSQKNITKSQEVSPFPSVVDFPGFSIITGSLLNMHNI